jgi:hypothetical protein
MDQPLFLVGEEVALVIVKWATVVSLLIYLVFAGVIIKQVKQMTYTLVTGFDLQIKIFVYLHFVFTLIILVMALTIL